MTTSISHWLMHFTAEGFEDAFRGRGAGGNGLLSRIVIAYSTPIPFLQDWPERDYAKELAVVERMKLRTPPQPDGMLYAQRFVPEFATTAVRDLFTDFARTVESPTSTLYQYARRLVVLTKVDILDRVLYTGSKVITQEHVDRGIAWGMHQIELHQALWPVDRGSPVEIIERKIVEELTRHPEGQTTRQLQKFTNAHRGLGGIEAFNRAFKALLNGGVVEAIAR